MSLPGLGPVKTIQHWCRVAYDTHERLHALVNKYQMVLLMKAQQNAACHALHTVNSRLCRWPLQAQDTIGSDKLELMQEFLSHMLGVRRNTVSVEAHILQKAGLIRYKKRSVQPGPTAEAA
jgi:hypothetical protein